MRVLFMTVFKVFTNANNENTGATVKSAPTGETTATTVESEVATAEEVQGEVVTDIVGTEHKAENETEVE